MLHGVSYEYEKMSPEDRRKFDEWIGANAILGAVCAVGILAMAFAGFSSLGRSDAVIAANSKSGKERGTTRVAVPESRLTYDRLAPTVGTLFPGPRATRDMVGKVGNRATKLQPVL